MMIIQAEAYKNQSFHCVRCKSVFYAAVATWVDASRAPYVKTLLNRWEFNIVTCPHCGNRQFSGSFFFYEDFAEGLLLGVFPTIPENHVSLEEEIKKQYGHYPALDFFYDMTQLWFFIYLQEYYNKSQNAATLSRIGKGEKRLQTFLHFVKTDPLMLTLRQILADTFSGNKTNDDLQDVLWRAVTKIEGASARRRVSRYVRGRLENEASSV